MKCLLPFSCKHSPLEYSEFLFTNFQIAEKKKNNKKQKTKKAPTVGSESYLKLALKIVKLSAPRSCLFT